MGQRPSQPLDNERRESKFTAPAALEDNDSGYPPFTPRGVASFSQTKWSRLFLWQIGVASAIGCSVMLLLVQHWAPVLNQAIKKLPDEGGLNQGRLRWPENHTGELASNQFLKIIVNPSGQQQNNDADLQIELRRESWVLGSKLGFNVELSYLLENFRIDRSIQIPWWGSRQPFLFIGISSSVGLAYIIASLFLGFLGIWPSKVVTFFSERQSDFGSLWRLATAVWLLPGALLAVGTLCYVFNLLIFLKLLILTLFCLLIGSFYLFTSPFFLPRAIHSEANPFDPEEAQADLEREENTSDSDNPFD